MAVDGAHVFWSSTGTEGLGRAGLDGGGMQVDFLPNAGAPLGIDVDATHIYWANDNGVARSNLDGTDVVQGFITSGYNLSGMAVDRAHIYWSDSYLGKIGRANLDGSGQHWIVKKIGVYGLAVDALGPQAPALRRIAFRIRK